MVVGLRVICCGYECHHNVYRPYYNAQNVAVALEIWCNEYAFYLTFGVYLEHVFVAANCNKT